MNKEDKNIIEFIQKTTEVITIISESTKAMNANLISMKDLAIRHENETINGIEMVKGKMESLKMIFFYVIIPLIAGILALVGVKFLDEIPK